MTIVPKDIVADFLANTAPDKVQAAADRLVAEDADYISLNFENADLKKILPWTGTQKGRQAYVETFLGVARWWTIDAFSISAIFGEGEDVAVFGDFTYTSNTLGKTVRSPLAIHAKVRNGVIVAFMFMEDTFATSRSFSADGSWSIKTPAGPEFTV